jgi:hypothetical protein
MSLCAEKCGVGRPGGVPCPGHIDLEVIDPDGDVLEKCIIDYDRPSPESRYANFHAVLKTTPPLGSTIRVVHDSRVDSSGDLGRCNGTP